MIHKILLPLILTLFFSSLAWADRGDIDFIRLLESQDAAALGEDIQEGTGFAASFLGIQYDVNLYIVGYETLDFDGVSPTIATGLICIPIGFDCDLPMLTYGHGLTLKNSGAPSVGNGTNAFIAKGMASNGYIAVLPDYIHLGQECDPGKQGFMHAETEANATIDLIRAARNYCEEQGIVYSDQLFISGYSQGGHSSMATCKMIQEKHSEEFDITAAIPGGGTFDLSGIAADSLASPTRTTGEPHALCLVVRSYMHIYQDSLKNYGYEGLTIDDLFRSPYDSLLNMILDQDNEFGNTSLLDEVPNRMLEDEFRIPFQNDPDYFMRKFLGYNNLYDWAPQMKMRIFHSRADVENPYPNVEKAYARFLELGAPDVELKTIEGLGHAEAGIIHVLELKNYFASMKAACPAVGLDMQTANPPRIYPNPFEEDILLELPTEWQNRIRSIELYNANGQLMKLIEVKDHRLNWQIKANDLQNGLYFLSIKGDGIEWTEALVK